MKLTIYIYSMCLYLIWKLFKFKANSFPRGGSLKKKSTERKDRRLRSGNDREGSLVGRKAKSPTQVGGWGREKVFAIFLVFTSMASCSVSESCDLPQVLHYPEVQHALPFSFSWREQQLNAPRRLLFFITSIRKLFQSARKVFWFLSTALFIFYKASRDWDPVFPWKYSQSIFA